MGVGSVCRPSEVWRGLAGGVRDVLRRLPRPVWQGSGGFWRLVQGMRRGRFRGSKTGRLGGGCREWTNSLAVNDLTPKLCKNDWKSVPLHPRNEKLTQALHRK